MEARVYYKKGERECRTLYCCAQTNLKSVKVNVADVARGYVIYSHHKYMHICMQVVTIHVRIAHMHAIYVF